MMMLFVLLLILISTNVFGLKYTSYAYKKYSTINYKSNNKVNKNRFLICNNNNNNIDDIDSSIDNNNNNNNNKAMKYGLIGLSTLGLVETGYLTFAKLTSSSLISNFCSSSSSSSSCSDVLSSPYSEIPGLNIPLSLVAFLGYTSVAIMSSYSLMDNGNNDNNKFNTPILFISSAMAAFSIYLMMILTFVLKDSCNFCYLSAFLSTSMALLSWNSRIEPNKTKAAVVTSSSVILTALSSAFLFYTTSIFTITDTANALNSRGPDAQDVKEAVAALKKIKQEEAEIKNMPKVPPTITKHSSEEALQVAKRLKSMDAKMYGAYWCSHCFNQKQNLGIEAKTYFEYIECDKEGENSQNGLCKSKKVPGYPTWEIAGQLYPGEKEIDELDKLLTSIEKNKDLFKD